MNRDKNNIVHDHLPCGLEYGVYHLPNRRIVCFQIRILSGCCTDPADKLGLTRLIGETIDKGTQQYDGQGLSDAFDAIGAGRNGGTGRETTTFTCTVLPEHFEQAVALHAEFLRNPTFPEDACGINIDLARQDHTALEDDAQSLISKLMNQKVFGLTLGRHALGEPETLDKITRDSLIQHWRDYYHVGRMVVSVSGPIDATTVAEIFAKHFTGFGRSVRAGRSAYPLDFLPGLTHHHKDLEQQQIAIAWPGVDVTHDDLPVQQVILGILSGGMSGRLFTEVREKRGLVYWVGAWQESPRGIGMLYMGASTTAERCDQTYHALLREVERLGEDVEKDELDRAITGILANQETRGDSTRARCVELAGDLFYFGRPIPMEEKIAKVKAVTMEDIRRFLATYPRDQRCVFTLGPRPLGNRPTEDQIMSEKAPV